MKLGIVLGAALLVGPGVAVAQTQANQPSGTQPSGTQMQQPSGTQMQQPSGTQMQQPSGTQMQQPSGTQMQQPSGTQMEQPSGTQMGQQPSAMKGEHGQAAATTQKILPKDAKLIGTVEEADVREFPEQYAQKGQKTGNVEKEGVVGVGAVDRIWTTKQPYKQTVTQIEQKLKGEGIEPLAKVTTQSATAWNVRMPDGHIANVVVRNTQPTTIEAVHASEVTGTVTDQQQQQQQAPSSKSKTNDTANPR